MIEEDPERYRVGDVAGVSGLQARYDEQLGGTPGVVVDAVRPSGKSRELFRADPVDGEPLRADPRPGPPARGRGPALRRRPGQRARGAATLERRPARRRQRPGHRRLQHGDLRAVRARLDVQEREQPGPAARRADPRLDRAVHLVDHRRRQALRELRRLPVLGPRPDPAAHRGRQLVQHRLHQPGPQGRGGRPRRRRRVARPRGRPRPRLPVLLRAGAEGEVRRPRPPPTSSVRAGSWPRRW